MVVLFGFLFGFFFYPYSFSCLVRFPWLTRWLRVSNRAIALAPNKFPTGIRRLSMIDKAPVALNFQDETTLAWLRLLFRIINTQSHTNCFSPSQWRLVPSIFHTHIYAQGQAPHRSALESMRAWRLLAKLERGTTRYDPRVPPTAGGLLVRRACETECRNAVIGHERPGAIPTPFHHYPPLQA